ncbi:unnamed protein product [Durusdinium trenchii]|uniref:Cilia- and flagella-associated protein 58 central coiled coil domain-containing protein n=1 Tax=Durusdinium trenchii TaxID=1381693 RepID=A0ABP0QFZ0_9DINO
MAEAEAAKDSADGDFEASAFEQLERDFQEILQELVGDKSLEHFRNEYEKLHRALKKSHESEKHLIKKCRELNGEIVQNAVKVQTALKLSQEDHATITALKKEIERAWKMVEASHEKEQRARETIQNLKSEITKLGRLVEQGAGLSINQENMVNQLVQEKNDLVKHRDMLQGQVQQMQQQNTDLNAKVAKLEQERLQGNGELLKLRESFQKLQEEADKQQKRKEKLDKELKDMRQGLEAKQSEVNAKREELSRGEEVQKHLSRVLREEKQEEERLGIRCTQLNGNAQHLDKQVREEMTAKNRLEEEQKDLKAQLKFRQDEINALRSSKAKTQKTLEALQALKDKDDAESRRLEARSTQMRGEVSELRKELEKLKRDSEAQEKQVTDLLHERDILGKALMKGEERSKQQVELVDLHKGQAQTLSKDLHRWKSDLDLKLQRIHELDRQREKYSGDLQQAKQRCEAAQEELRGRELQMAQLKRSIADVRAKWAQQKNLYEAVRTDKNLYSKNLVESLEEINEMRKKFKVMCHQIEQLKEEIKEKDVAMIAEHFKHQGISKETEKTKHNLEYHEKQQTRAQQLVEQQSSDIKKLEATIQEAESERQNQRKEFEAVTAERNILGKQLIRRNEELSLIYEKIKIQESTLSKGEVQYRKLLDRLHEQRTDIGELKRDLFIARQQAESAGSLEKEVYHLQRELLQERTKVRALSEELENPMNVHRWRKLEGSDPGMYELIQKVRSLQMRLIAKTEEVVVKDSEIQEKDKLHKELNAILEKQPGPEVLEQLEQYQETYNSKLKQMKAMQGELQTYQSQVSDYKDEIDRLNRELQEVKKKFYDQKKREMIQQEAQRGDGRVIHPRPVPQATAARSQHRAARPAAPAAGAGGAGARPVPVITLPKDKEAEHYVIHSDVSTPSAHRARVDGRRVVSVRRRRSEAERKPSPVERRRSSPQRSASAKPRSKPGIELSPPQEERSEETEEEVKVPAVSAPAVEPAAESVTPASPHTALRREIDVLRLQVQTMREVQEQTAEIHWKVISNVVEERNAWETRYKEMAQRAKEAAALAPKVVDAAVSMTPAPSPVKEAPRSGPAFKPSFCRSVVQPKIDFMRPQVVTRYTLPSSLCISSLPEGLATMGRCLTPMPQQACFGEPTRKANAPQSARTGAPGAPRSKRFSQAPQPVVPRPSEVRSTGGSVSLSGPSPEGLVWMEDGA